MKYAISATISTAEHDEDREEMRQQFLAGDRPAYDPDTGDEELLSEIDEPAAPTSLVPWNEALAFADDVATASGWLADDKDGERR